MYSRNVSCLSLLLMVNFFLFYENWWCNKITVCITCWHVIDKCIMMHWHTKRKQRRRSWWPFSILMLLSSWVNYRINYCAMGKVQIMFFKGKKIIKKQPQTLQYSGLFTFNTSGNRLLLLDTTTTPSGFFQNLELVIIGTVCKISPWWKSKTKAYLYNRKMILIASSKMEWYHFSFYCNMVCTTTQKPQ